MRPIHIFRFAVIIFSIACSAKSFAQIDSCNLFIKGRYVEVGISGSGAYGSSAVAPPGYHSSVVTGSVYMPCGTTSPAHCLGFVADPAMDGWTVGTPPFFGDYFLPGTPFEGWAMEINGGPRADAWNTLSGTGIPGTNTAYTTSGSIITGTWVGSVDSVTVKQETSLDTNNLYFTVKVTLTNTSSTPKNNIYYLRSLDPDNDEMQSYNFSTKNKIEYQLPNTLNATVVSAAGLTYPAAFLGLGTADTNAKCFIYTNWASYPSTSVSIASMYNQTTGGGLGAIYYAMGDTTNTDIAIGLAFRVAHIAPVDSAADSIARVTSSATLHPANTASFTYFYAFSPAAVDSAIHALTITVPPLEIKNSTTAADINIYPNPATNELIIKAGQPLYSFFTITNTVGQQVMRQQLAGEQTNVNVRQLPAGLYYLTVRSESGVKVMKFEKR
ncbi:MAG: T9SS type A sorting domain-containing protein [Chitinophagales bacterium]